MDGATAAALLRGIAADLAAGDDLRLGGGDEAASVPLPDAMDVEVGLEVDVEDDETELEIELEWPGGEATTAGAVPSAPAVTTTDDGDAPGAAGADAAAPDSADADTDAETPGIAATDAGDLPTEAIPAPDAAPPVSLARFELYRDRGDQWRWRLVHRNGNIVATSGEGYSSDRAARRGMQSVIRNAPGAAVLRDE